MFMFGPGTCLHPWDSQVVGEKLWIQKKKSVDVIPALRLPGLPVTLQ